MTQSAAGVVCVFSSTHPLKKTSTARFGTRITRTPIDMSVETRTADSLRSLAVAPYFTSKRSVEKLPAPSVLVSL